MESSLTNQKLKNYWGESTREVDSENRKMAEGKEKSLMQQSYILIFSLTLYQQTGIPFRREKRSGEKQEWNWEQSCPGTLCSTNTGEPLQREPYSLWGFTCVQAGHSLHHGGQDRPERCWLGLVDFIAEQRKGECCHLHRPLTEPTCTFLFLFFKRQTIKSKMNEITWDQDTKTEIQCRKKDLAGKQSMENTGNISKTHKKLTL